HQQNQSSLRTPVVHDFLASEGSSQKPIIGVKGTSHLQKVLQMPIDIPLDTMHLVYLGMTKRLFLHLMQKRLIDIEHTSYILTSIKVPISIRRKPRGFDFVQHWKAMEWKYFLLYYSVICLHDTTEIQEEILLMVILFSTAIYLLSSANVSEAEISSAKRLLLLFQQMVSRYLGKELMVYNTHALIHLPDQVKLFGPLWVTSVSMFESAFGIFKSFVKGSRNEATQMIARFIRYQKYSPGGSSENEENEVKCLGNLHAINRDTVVNFGLDLEEIIGEVFRISVKDMLFTSYNYRRKEKSASYYATAVENECLVFVRIDYIVVDKHNKVTCLCTSFTHENLMVIFKSGFASREIGLFDLLMNFCPIKLLRYGRLLALPAERLRMHFIGYESKEHFYAVPMLMNFEHD
ncbi:MAG: hypothetical protein AAGK05_14045, partial [Pseudomonadota bacterium]